jgi:catechol 2,3-dioxygenase-like lactoylglutathione lyase family enzyme
METLIAKLLHDFENGKMDRRQLIRSLAVAAVAGPAAAAVDPKALAASTTAAPWKTVFMDHISYAVSDHKRTAAWYADLMGWTINNQSDTQTSMSLGEGLGGIIIRTRGGGRAGAAAAAGGAAGAAAGAAGAGGGGGAAAQQPITGVINHISYGISPWNKDAVKEELTRRGLNPRDDFQGDSFESYHVRDPEGWDLQISNQTS